MKTTKAEIPTKENKSIKGIKDNIRRVMIEEGIGTWTHKSETIGWREENRSMQVINYYINIDGATFAQGKLNDEMDNYWKDKKE